MKLYAQFLAALLAVLLVMVAFAACQTPGENQGDSSTAVPGGETSVPAADSGGEDTSESRLNVHDDLPDGLKYNGATFTVLGLEGVHDFVLDETEPTGRLDSALFRRDQTVEERLDIDIVYVAPGFDQLPVYFQNSIASQESTYDLYLGQVVRTGVEVLNGNCLKWSELPYVNFDKPWYPANTVAALTLNGKQYINIGALNISSLAFTNCVFFSKDRAEDHKIGDIYDIVNNGEWTYDRLFNIVKDLYIDENRNNVADEGDFYGLSVRSGDIPVFMWAFDQKLVTFADDGTFELTFMSDKTVDIVNKVRSLFYDTIGTTSLADAATDWDGIAMFRNNRSLFDFGLVGQTLWYLADYENYGIIPYPKYNEDQKEYYTFADGSSTGMVVPTYVEDTRYVSAVIEALNAESWRTCELEYYNIALKTRGTRDDESIAMLDLLFAGRVTDIQYIHDAWKGFAFSLEILCQPNNKTELASFYQSKVDAVTAHYQSLVDWYFGDY